MINDEIKNAATERFCANPYWKKYHDNAPDGAKERIELTFCNSIFGEKITPEEFAAERKRIHRALSNEDITYLMENCESRYKGLLLKQIQADRASSPAPTV